MNKSILTLFGLGYKKFSATTASFIALLFFLVLKSVLDLNLFLFFLVLFKSMMDLSKNPDFSSSDPKEVVVDEFLGMLLCLIIVDSTDILINFLLFVIFRLLDIFKPFPFNWIDKKVTGKYALLIDDLAIGLTEGLLVLVFLKLLIS